MDKFLEIARKASKNSYSPYSKFPVGACVVLKNQTYFLGTNVENGSYGLTCCAERNALFNAYSNGVKKEDIEKIYIVGNTKKPISPCGACRQVINELMEKDAKVILGSNLNNEIKELKVSDLIPYPFNFDE